MVQTRGASVRHRAVAVHRPPVPSRSPTVVWPPRPLDPAQLNRCLLLAVLLHLWLMLLLGNTPGGSARLGEGQFGSLNSQISVTLKDARTRVGDGPSGAPPTETSAARGPLGEARQQRHGGTVRTEPVPADAGPGAARAGSYSPTPPADADPAQPLSGSAAEVDAGAAAPKVLLGPETTAPTPAARSLEAVPRPSPSPATAPMAEKLTPLPTLPAPTATLAAPQPQTKTSLPSLPRPAAPAATRTPATEMAPLPELAAPTSTLNAPAAQARPAPLPAVSRTAPAAPATAANTVAPLPELPAPTATLNAPAAQPRQTPLPAVPRAATPDQPAATPALTPLPDLPAAPVAAPAAPAATATATPAPTPAPTTPSTAPAATPSTAPTTTPSTAPATAPTISNAPPTPSPGTPLGRPSGGAPDAGARIGHDVATPPSVAPSAPRPALNLSLPREVSSRGSRGVLPVVPHPPELKTKLEKEMEKAGRDDCRKAHSEMGLLAVVPIVADTVRGKGCRW